MSYLCVLATSVPSITLGAFHGRAYYKQTACTSSSGTSGHAHYSEWKYGLGCRSEQLLRLALMKVDILGWLIVWLYYCRHSGLYRMFHVKKTWGPLYCCATAIADISQVLMWRHVLPLPTALLAPSLLILAFKDEMISLTFLTKNEGIILYFFISTSLFLSHGCVMSRSIVFTGWYSLFAVSLGSWDHQYVEAGWQELCAKRWDHHSSRKIQWKWRIIWKCFYLLHNHRDTLCSCLSIGLCEEVWGAVLWPCERCSQKSPSRPDRWVHWEV